MRTDVSPIKATDIYRYYTNVAVKRPHTKWANFFVVPSTIVLERYIAPLLIAAILNDIQHGTVTLSAAMWLIVGYIAIQLLTQVVGYRVILYIMWSFHRYVCIVAIYVSSFYGGNVCSHEVTLLT
jgi:hypothetical protein